MASRPRQTLADYVAIAISPVLIMVLVGSLVFFLQELVFEGESAGRLKWVLFWFVFAAVLIARIGIEQGDEHAAVYMVAFWGAVSLVIFRFVEQPLIGFVLLGVTWWSARKLTWDCTLIDDSQDASGQGLLQITGLDQADSNSDETQDQQTPPPQEPPPDAESNDETEENSETRPHAPGLWVVYFSMAALPLFGLGQLWIPASDAARRTSAFRYLWFYVAAGLGLLLTTSFLGLRRYLRQRKLTMPARMTGSWIGMGAALALGILIVGLILPRPHANYSITNLVDTVSNKVGQASDQALGSDDAGEGEGNRAGREATDEEASEDGEGKKGNQGKNAGETSNSDQPASGGNGKKDGKGDSQNNGNADSQNAEDGENTAQKQQPDAASSSSVGSKIASVVKLLIYLAIGIFGVFFAIRHWSVISDWFAQLLDDLRNLFGGRTRNLQVTGDSDDEDHPLTRIIRPFAEYANPFRSGMVHNMDTVELIEYTYDALKAFGAEHGWPKRADQTPTEYLQELVQHIPALGAAVREVARLYVRAAYSQSPPSSQSHPLLENAWTNLEQAANQPV